MTNSDEDSAYAKEQESQFFHVLVFLLVTCVEVRREAVV